MNIDLLAFSEDYDQMLQIPGFTAYISIFFHHQLLDISMRENQRRILPI